MNYRALAQLLHLRLFVHPTVRALVFRAMLDKIIKHNWIIWNCTFIELFHTLGVAEMKYFYFYSSFFLFWRLMLSPSIKFPWTAFEMPKIRFRHRSRRYSLHLVAARSSTGRYVVFSMLLCSFAYNLNI